MLIGLTYIAFAVAMVACIWFIANAFDGEAERQLCPRFDQDRSVQSREMTRD
jgi:hypothetical protein